MMTLLVKALANRCSSLLVDLFAAEAAASLTSETVSETVAVLVEGCGTAVELLLAAVALVALLHCCSIESTAMATRIRMVQTMVQPMTVPRRRRRCRTTGARERQVMLRGVPTCGLHRAEGWKRERPGMVICTDSLHMHLTCSWPRPPSLGSAA